jgi:hypothetical protein
MGLHHPEANGLTGGALPLGARPPGLVAQLGLSTIAGAPMAGGEGAGAGAGATARASV